MLAYPIRMALAGAASLLAMGPPAAAPTPLCTSPARACLERTVDAYFTGLLKGDGSAVPFADNVRATEQETVAVTNRAGFLAEFKASGAIKGFRDRRYYTDAQSGDVTAFLLVDVRAVAGAKPFTVRRAQRFRVRNGLITQVEILNYVSASEQPLWPSPQK